MEIKKLEQEAKDELLKEDVYLIKDEIKERLREIRSAEKILAKLKAKYESFLDGDTDELLF